MRYSLAMLYYLSIARTAVRAASASATAAPSAFVTTSRRLVGGSSSSSSSSLGIHNHVLTTNSYCGAATTTTRLFSSTATAPSAAGGGSGFDADASRLYKIIAENHRHPTGPWTTMLEKVHDYANVHGGNFRLLDLATGPGEPAETIARQFPDATVVATDLSPDQVAYANAQTATLPHMTAQVADMENLCDFDDNSFDMVTCCYGFMFPPNIPQAVSEAHRVLKPGGVLIATTWNRIGMMEKLRAIMTDVLGGQAPPPPPMNPLALKEPGLFPSMLEEAGFENVQQDTHEYPMDMTKDPDTQFQASVMLVKDKLSELDAWDKAKEAYEKHKMDYGAFNDHGHWMILGNEYQLTVCQKKNKQQ